MFYVYPFIHYLLRFLCIHEYNNYSLSVHNSCVHFPPSGFVTHFWFHVFIENTVFILPQVCCVYCISSETWNY